MYFVTDELFDDAFDLSDSDDHDELPLSFEKDPPDPLAIPSAPDDLAEGIEDNMRGLSRVSVKVKRGRKSFTQINAVILGAKYDETPRATAQQIERAVMAIAQDRYEMSGEPTGFMAQLLVYKKATGNRKKIAFHFVLGADEHGGIYTESRRSDSEDESIFIAHIRECHREILDQAKLIGAIGKAAIENAGQVFVAKNEAAEAKAEALMIQVQAERDSQQDAAKEKKWDRGFKMFEKMMDKGMGQIAMAKLTGASQSAPVAPSPATVTTTATPSWAEAATGGTVTQLETPETQTQAPAKPIEDTVEAEIDGIEMDDYLAKARHLYSSITAEQWPELFTILTKKQVELLKECKNPPNLDALWKTMRELAASLKEKHLKAVGQICSQAQMALIIELQIAAPPAD